MPAEVVEVASKVHGSGGDGDGGIGDSKIFV